MRVVRYINGIPTTVDLSTTINYYDESILVSQPIGTPGTGYNDAHTIFTLPNAETYDGTIDQLKIYVNGVAQVEGVDFTYEASASATTITFTEAIPQNARVRFRKDY